MTSPIPAFIVLALIASGYLWVAVKRSRIVEPERYSDYDGER